MSPVYALDTEKFCLGNGCPKKHYWPGTTKSPRRRSNGHCVGCYLSARKGDEWILRFVDFHASGYDKNFYIGKLCARGHKWEGFNRSLNFRNPPGSKYIGMGRCVECICIDASQPLKEKTRKPRKIFDKSDPYSTENISILRESIACNNSHGSGLMWIKSSDPRQPVGSTAGYKNAEGKWVLLYKNTTLSPQRIILLLNGIMPPVDERKEYIATRIDPKGPWNDVQNLRWALRGDAIGLSAELRRADAELRRADLVRAVLGHDELDLGERYRLNAPCKNGHLWNGYQLSLHRKSGPNWKCDQCERERESKKNKNEETKERQREKYQANIDEERARGRQRMKKLRETDPDFAEKNRLYARKRKAMLRGNTVVLVTPSQIRARFAEFSHCCAFCNIDLMAIPKSKRTVEHLIPIIKGGPHSLGNIVPSCLSCNSSKTDHDVEIWYRRQPFFTETRWRKIKRFCPDASTGQLPLL